MFLCVRWGAGITDRHVIVFIRCLYATTSSRSMQIVVKHVLPIQMHDLLGPLPCVLHLPFEPVQGPR